MRKNFYIFRHGETDLNRERRWQGQKYDFEINEKGKRQAEELAEKLKGTGIEIIYSSPMKRAAMTAEIVAKKLHVPLFFDDGLKEGNFGVMEGLTREEAESIHKDQVDRWMSPIENLDCCFDGGETKRQIGQRVKSVLKRALDTPYDVIGISSHGGAMRQFLSLVGAKLDGIPNTAVFHVVYEDGDWVLR